MILLEITAEWNIKVKNIFEIRRIKIEENEDENFQFSLMMKIYFFEWIFFWKKICIHREKIPGIFMFFFCKSIRE